jgi:hypothetical protein
MGGSPAHSRGQPLQVEICPEARRMLSVRRGWVFGRQLRTRHPVRMVRLGVARDRSHPSVGAATAEDRGRAIRAIVSSTAQTAAKKTSSFKLLGVRGPPRGMSVATSTAFLWFPGSYRTAIGVPAGCSSTHASSGPIWLGGYCQISGAGTLVE